MHKNKIYCPFCDRVMRETEVFGVKFNVYVCDFCMYTYLLLVRNDINSGLGKNLKEVYSNITKIKPTLTQKQIDNLNTKKDL